jgi:hypothetical protein
MSDLKDIYIQDQYGRQKRIRSDQSQAFYCVMHAIELKRTPYMLHSLVPQALPTSAPAITTHSHYISSDPLDLTMRLLNVSTMQLEQHIADIPFYVILSHT